ncbi:MAG: aminofutalosine synthase MqnE [Hydrogenobaculum sp.]
MIELLEDKEVSFLLEKALNKERLTEEEAIFLYKNAPLSALGYVANELNKEKNQDRAFFIVNRYLNPTNICVYKCKFCSFGVSKSDERAFELSIDEVLRKIESSYKKGITEVHIVGGLPPHWEREDYVNLIKVVKQNFPDIVIKAYTAVEIDHIAKISKSTYEDVLLELKEAGLSLLPGGGAEIFADRVRNIIAPNKANAEEYLEIHETAHKLGIPSNVTMLYGHIETIEERVDHMKRIRNLQDKTAGFQVFIPLAYHPKGTSLGGERTSSVDDLKTIAMSRIFLDNFDNIKAYWITLGEKLAQIALNFGANDIDGTLEEELVVHAAGSTETYGKTVDKLISIIKGASKIPVQRDSFYNIIKVYN